MEFLVTVPVDDAQFEVLEALSDPDRLKEKPSTEQPDRHREKSLHTESAGSFSFGFAGRTVASALKFL